MNMKHTPGPWEIDTDTRPAEICTIHGVTPQGEDGQGWVYVRGALGRWDDTPKERMANARLIAAAPDLLAALDALLLDIGGASSLPGAVMARAAIAKATGAV